MALLPSLKYQTLRPNSLSYPQALTTLGDHIRAKRLDLDLQQKEAARRIGVNPWTILNWEKNNTQPHSRTNPNIMKFLGYCPVQYPQSIGERIRLHRVHRGLSILDLANILGVDESTVGNWERNVRCPYRRSEALKQKIYKLL